MGNKNIAEIENDAIPFEFIDLDLGETELLNRIGIAHIDELKAKI